MNITHFKKKVIVHKLKLLISMLNNDNSNNLGRKTMAQIVILFIFFLIYMEKLFLFEMLRCHGKVGPSWPADGNLDKHMQTIL